MIQQHTRREMDGFSLIEFIVIISIFAILAGVTMFNFGNFSTGISLSNLSQDVALAIKEAQTYGIANQSTDPLNLDFNAIPVGVGFTSSGGVFSNNFVLFEDTNYDGNQEYAYSNTSGISGGDVDVQIFSITGGDRIVEVCLYDTDGDIIDQACDESVSITFKRSNPEAVFNNDDEFARAEVVLESARGNQKVVRITRLGQISVVN